MKTHLATQSEIQTNHKFHVIDANGIVLGRLATEVATLLRGKHKAIFNPAQDTGDHVIVINADKINLSGRKADDKFMTHHTKYPGGLKRKPYRLVLEQTPERAVMKAVWGMMPKNRLGRKLMKKLRVYKGSSHPHAANKPVPYQVK
ncbi:50S ribosomal protein L13 [bacterium]|nr:50S ribosomal protein L13 [bacterium]